MAGARMDNTLQILTLGFRIILGVLFVYAGAEKAIDPAGFAQAIGNYHILPGWMINSIAVILPWIEIVTGTSLLIGMFLPGGALIISSLLFVFVCALGISMIRGLDIDCGCFSSAAGRNPITWRYVLRDIVLFGMACTVFSLSQCSRFSLDAAVQKFWSRER